MSILNRRGLPMRESLHDYCMREGRKELRNEWVADTNLPLTRTGVSRGSKRKAMDLR